MMKRYALPILAIVSLASALVFAFPTTVQSGGNIQSAINAAKAGDVITVAPPTATKTVTPSATSSKTPTPTMGCVQAFDVWVCNFNPLP